MTRILIADDNPTIRKCLCRLLSRRVGWEVCGEACDGEEAVWKVEHLVPDMVVMDLSMPRKNGLEAAREIKKASPSIPILLWTISSLSSELLDLARRAGIAGTLSKSSVGNLVTSIETILGGGAYFSRDDNPASTC